MAAHITLKEMAIVYIGLGANLPSAAGPPDATLAAALQRLGTLGRLTERSSLYSTEPVGFADQPRFVNAAVALETELPPRELLAALLQIEKEFGRDRRASIANGPRTLDLDILLVEDVYISEPGLEVPHPRLAERSFVLVPLNEIAPQARDPRTGATVAQLFQRLFPVSSDAYHAVNRIESKVWRGRADGADSGRDDHSRAVIGNDHG